MHLYVSLFNRRWLYEGVLKIVGHMDHNRPAALHTGHHVWQAFGKHQNGLLRQNSLLLITNYNLFFHAVKSFQENVAKL